MTSASWGASSCTSASLKASYRVNILAEHRNRSLPLSKRSGRVFIANVDWTVSSPGRASKRMMDFSIVAMSRWMLSSMSLWSHGRIWKSKEKYVIQWNFQITQKRMLASWKNHKKSYVMQEHCEIKMGYMTYTTISKVQRLAYDCIIGAMWTLPNTAVNKVILNLTPLHLML